MTWLILKTLITKTRQEFLEKYWYLSHWIHHNKKIDDYENIHSVNPLYLIINKAGGYIEKNDGNKYFIFASTNKNKKVLTKYAEL